MIIIILVNNRISVVVMSGSSKISGINWRSLTLLLIVADWRSNVFFDDADLFFPLVPALARLPSLAWIVFFVLLVGLAILAIRMEMKCYDVVTRENIALQYNMQVMCNWMWCIIVDMYSMIVDYVLSIVDYDFNIVAYDITIVDCDFTLWDYILTLVENIISLSRIYTHLVDYIISFSRPCSHYSRLCIHFMRLCTHNRLDYIIILIDYIFTVVDYKISRTYIMGSL